MADMPRNLRYLTGEVERLANERGIAMLRLRTLVANEVVAQMLRERFDVPVDSRIVQFDVERFPFGRLLVGAEE